MGYVPFSGNDLPPAWRYDRHMAAPQIDWYLKEWLPVCGRNAAWLERESNWSHRITSQLINRKTRWNRDHLALATRLLNLAPYELLMHPDEAMHIRRLRASAAEEYRLRAAEERQPWHGKPPQGGTGTHG